MYEYSMANIKIVDPDGYDILKVASSKVLTLIIIFSLQLFANLEYILGLEMSTKSLLVFTHLSDFMSLSRRGMPIPKIIAAISRFEGHVRPQIRGQKSNCVGETPLRHV